MVGYLIETVSTLGKIMRIIWSIRGRNVPWRCHHPYPNWWTWQHKGQGQESQWDTLQGKIGRWKGKIKQEK